MSIYGKAKCENCGAEDHAHLLFKVVDEGVTECQECFAVSGKTLKE